MASVKSIAKASPKIHGINRNGNGTGNGNGYRNGNDNGNAHVNSSDIGNGNGNVIDNGNGNVIDNGIGDSNDSSNGLSEGVEGVIQLLPQLVPPARRKTAQHTAGYDANGNGSAVSKRGNGNNGNNINGTNGNVINGNVINSNGSAHSLDSVVLEEDSRTKVLAMAHDNLNGYIRFYHDVMSWTGNRDWPDWTQSLRTKALMKNKRVGVFDDPGVNGKTFIAVFSKICLDRYNGHNHPTLVIAPNSGMLNAWAPDEINRYASHVNARLQKTITIESYNQLKSIPPQTDFVVVNWEKISVSANDKRYKVFYDMIDSFKPEFYVLDESHNAKSSTSLRGQNIRNLVGLTLDKYVMLLSATPIPNRLRDLASVFHILDPKTYTEPAKISYLNPEIIRRLIHEQNWLRVTTEQMKEKLGLAEFREVEVPVNLTDAEAEVYFKAWSDCVLLGEGLSELRKCLYDARLSKYSAGLELPMPSKLKALRDLTARLNGEGQKVIIKTNYVTNLIGKIADAVDVDRKTLLITGDTPHHERKSIVNLFRFDKRYNRLIISPVLEESVDCTTGNVPCSIISIEPEMTPREFTQLTGRVYRRGQTADVTHYTLVAQSAALNSMMVGYLEHIANEYEVRIPKKFIPRTIDADMIAMRQTKQQIADRVLEGDRITKKEEHLYDAEALNSAITHMQGMVAPSSFKQMGPFQLSILIQARWRNIGQEHFEALVKTRGFRRWCKMYEDGWKNSGSQITLKQVGKIVDGLEQKLGYDSHEATVVDLGSGAAYFSRATGRAVTCVDLDPKFLAMGKAMCEKKRTKINNDYVVGRATDTTLADSTADIAINSYMLMYLGQDKKRSEIEECALETNRIIKSGGYSIIALPYTIEEKAVARFSRNLKQYGFEQVAYYGRKGTDVGSLRHGCHILVHQKVADCTEHKGVDLSFYDNRVRFIG